MASCTPHRLVECDEKDPPNYGVWLVSVDGGPRISLRYNSIEMFHSTNVGDRFEAHPYTRNGFSGFDLTPVRK